MSNTKLIAGGAAVIVILSLTLIVVHRTHQAPQPSEVLVAWNPPLASDAATRQAEQQIQAQLALFAEGDVTQNQQMQLRALSPEFEAIDSGNRQPPMHYKDLERPSDSSPKATKLRARYLSHHPHEQFVVNSCSVTGSMATVYASLKWWNDTHPTPQILDACDVIAFENTGGKWFMTKFVAYGDTGKYLGTPQKASR